METHSVHLFLSSNSTQPSIDQIGTFNERLEQIIPLYNEGVAGNAISVKKANRLLEKLRTDYPNSPLADAYQGSTMVLVARDMNKQLEQLKWANNGLRLLDKAVAEAPQDSMIRLLRGKSTYNLPEKYFRRTQTAIEDYNYLINESIQLQGTINDEEYSQLIYELGEAYYRIGRNQDAINSWKMLDNLSISPTLRQLYMQKLQTLEGKPAVEIINYENPSDMLIGAARTVGSALVNWSEGKKDKGKKDKNKKDKNKKDKNKKSKNNKKDKKDKKNRD